MTVLIETILPSNNPVKIIESADGEKAIVLEGTAIQGEVKNHNDRIYPRDEIENAVAAMNQTIESFGPIIGECDHPEGLQINLDRATHLIENMSMHGNDGHARFKVIPVGLGEIVTGLIKYGAKLGVSSRGTGNVTPGGYVSDFDIKTIDVVANPSAPGAYPTPILESIQRSSHGQEANYLAEQLRHDPKAQEYFRKELLAFINEVY